MAILKIRDADGNIKPIAIMKGDKGDGIPDGGSAGQVVKKTADGTEWADFASTPAVVMSNTDTAVASATITQRGLYEVEVGYVLDYWDVSHYPYNPVDPILYKAIISVDDLSETSVWKHVLLATSRTGVSTANNPCRLYFLKLTRNSNLLSAQIVYKEGYYGNTDGIVEPEDVAVTDSIICIVEVKLLIPYA